MAQKGVKNGFVGLYADENDDKDPIFGFIEQKKRRVERPMKPEVVVEDEKSKLDEDVKSFGVEVAPDADFWVAISKEYNKAEAEKKLVASKRKSEQPVKKVRFDHKLFPYGQLIRVVKPYYLRSDSDNAKLELDYPGSVSYYHDESLLFLQKLSPIYHHLYKFWSEDGFANFHSLKPTWQSLDLLYGHRLKPEKFKLLHQLETRESKLRWMYLRSELIVDGYAPKHYLERHLGHLIPELDRHIDIAKQEKEQKENNGSTDEKASD